MKAIVMLVFILASSICLQAQTHQFYLFSVEQTPNVIEGWAINPTTGAIVADYQYTRIRARDPH
jgi:hypothetical protein